MALNIPSYPDPRDPANPLVNAYAFVSEVTFSWFGRSNLTININPNAAAWMGVPVDQVSVHAGEVLVQPVYEKEGGNPPTLVSPALTYPTFEEMMADPEFAQAFAVIGAKLQAALVNHPKLAGATAI